MLQNSVARPPRGLCNKAIKQLTQYQRLARKFGIRIPPQRLSELDRLRDQGRIRASRLPGKLRREFPTGTFDDMTLQEIRQLCGR